MACLSLELVLLLLLYGMAAVAVGGPSHSNIHDSYASNNASRTGNVVCNYMPGNASYNSPQQSDNNTSEAAGRAIYSPSYNPGRASSNAGGACRLQAPPENTSVAATATQATNPATPAVIPAALGWLRKWQQKRQRQWRQPHFRRCQI